MKHKENPMPVLSRSTQLAVAAVLALLMLTTRGTHFASIDALPSASWAVFFLAGALLRPLWGFGALFALASVIDLSLVESGRVADWCLSPAYWALLPAYGALWFAGRLYARLHREQLATLLPLGLCLIGGASLAYLCSGGGFYFFSGRYPDATLAGFLPRIGSYLPAYLGTLALYVGGAALAWVATRTLRGNAGAAAT
jgi:hypothetical protein